VLFNAGCNKQVFSPKPWKKNWPNPSCRFRENAHFNSKKWRHRAEV